MRASEKRYNTDREPQTVETRQGEQFMGTFWLYLTGKATGTSVGLLAGAQSSPADSLMIMATFFLGMIIIIFGVDLFFINNPRGKPRGMRR